VRAVLRLIDRLGFDAVDAGALDHGLALEPDGSPFAVTYGANELSHLVARRAGGQGDA
jgi:predicted dinucleotide-binding enzyme